MMEYLSIDSSVIIIRFFQNLDIISKFRRNFTIIASLRKEEEKHKSCRRLIERVKNREFIALEPYTVLVEVTAAMRRRTGSEMLSGRIKKDLESIDSILFFDLDRIRADDAARISAKIGVRGMDAVVIQIAAENKCALVTLDDEMSKRSKSIIEIKSVDDFI